MNALPSLQIAKAIEAVIAKANGSPFSSATRLISAEGLRDEGFFRGWAERAGEQTLENSTQNRSVH